MSSGACYDAKSIGECIDFIWRWHDHQRLTLTNTPETIATPPAAWMDFYKVIVGAFSIDQLNHFLLDFPLGFGSKFGGTEWFHSASEAAGVILFYSRGHNLSCL